MTREAHYTVDYLGSTQWYYNFVVSHCHRSQQTVAVQCSCCCRLDMRTPHVVEEEHCRNVECWYGLMGDYHCGFKQILKANEDDRFSNASTALTWLTSTSLYSSFSRIDSYWHLLVAVRPLLPRLSVYQSLWQLARHYFKRRLLRRHSSSRHQWVAHAY